MSKCRENQPCCSDPRQSCFGKRRDSFYCYNDDRAQVCPSLWQPDNSRFIIQRNCNQADSNAAATENQSDVSYPTSFPNRPDKKKNSEVKQLMNYFRNCIRQRYIIDWTEEDDQQLFQSSYNKVTTLYPNRTEEVLSNVLEQARRQNDDDMVMFAEKLLEKSSRSTAGNGRASENRRYSNHRSNSAGKSSTNGNSIDNYKSQKECKCRQCQKEAARSRNYDEGYTQCPKCGNSCSNQNGQPSCSRHVQSGYNEHEPSCPKSNAHFDPLPLRGGNDRTARRPNRRFNENGLDDTDFIIPPRRISPAECEFGRSLYDNGTTRHYIRANPSDSIDTFTGPKHLCNLHRMRM